MHKALWWAVGSAAFSLASAQDLYAQQAAAAVAAVDTLGVVTNLTVTVSGAGYLSTPLVTLGGGGGSNATARASMQNGSVKGIQILSGGAGYTSAPAVGIDPPDMPVSVLDLGRGNSVTLMGEIGSTHELQSAEALGDGQAWASLGSVVLTNSTWISTHASTSSQRYYRALLRGCERPAAPAGMVWLPPGVFQMGTPASDQDFFANEGPQTTVRLSQGFFLGRKEVTQGEYAALAGTNGSTFKGNPDLPVETVSWSEAVAFCDKLTQREQAAGRLPATWRFRLPSEAEWEYAARAGSTNRFGFAGDAIDENAWLADNSLGTTHGVGQKRPNAWGLFDLAGNVAEWCSDVYGSYPGRGTVDPLGAMIGQARIVRGGSGSTPASFCRAAARDARSSLGYRDAWVGFRVALAHARPEPPVELATVGGTISGKVSLKGSSYPVAGMAICLLEANGLADTGNPPNNRTVFLAASTTGLDGSYAFNNVQPGDYTVLPMTSGRVAGWQWDWDGKSDPPRLAVNSDQRIVNFTAQDPAMLEWGESGQFHVKIWMVNIPLENDRLDLLANRIDWNLSDPSFYRFPPLRKTADYYSPVLFGAMFNLSADYGYAASFHILDNLFQLEFQDERRVRWERFLMLPLTDCPENSLFTWDYLTGELKRDDSAVAPGMVWIPPGTFTMGSPDSELGREAIEGPQTKVTMTRGFWISPYETTQVEYESIMGNNPSMAPRHPLLPVSLVSWRDATNYCYRLTKQAREAGHLPAGYIFRLPTEAEWEYTCRAGTATATAFGASLSSSQANFDGADPYGGAVRGPSLGHTTQMDSYAPNAWGLYNMHGNVMEWCLDANYKYDGGRVADPRGIFGYSNRALRGGSFLSSGNNCRSACRKVESLYQKQPVIGFRKVLAPELVF